MKVKEKINKEIESNEALSLLKGLWDNKRYRSIFWLILYFIFFFVVIMSFETNPENKPTNTTSPEDILNVSESLQNLDNYSYEIFLNDDKSLVVGSFSNNINSFTYNNKDYMIIGDNIYLEDKMTLTKVDLTTNSDLIIPLNKITIDKIEEYIKDLEPSISQDMVSYSLSVSDILKDENLDFKINFYGNNKVEKIKLDFNEYVKLKEFDYEQYILIIKIGDVANV